MINEINASQRYGATGTVKSANQSSADNSAKTTQSDQSTKSRYGGTREPGRRRRSPMKM